MITRKNLVLASAFVLGITGAAVGAQANGAFGGAGMPPGPRHCERDRGVKIDMMETYIASKLNLTDAQKPAWNAVVDAINKASADRQAACKATKDQAKPATPMEALDRAEARMTQELDHLKVIRAKVADLYSQLSDQQKTTLNTLLDQMHHMREMHG